MEKGRIKRIIICIVAILIVFAFVVVYKIFNREEISFSENDKLFFDMFVNQFEQDEYEFYSLDAYYLEDEKEFYYNAKYKCYSSVDDTWYEIDEVTYGSLNKFYNSYCLSWDDLQDFEEVNKEFQRARKEGIHKTYTSDEIEEFLKEAHHNKEKQN